MIYGLQCETLNAKKYSENYIEPAYFIYDNYRRYF